MLRKSFGNGFAKVSQNALVAESSLAYDVVVVGSGLAGLAAARRLETLGKRVLVAEANGSIGGHLLPFSRGNQVFEVGLHYIADCGPGSEWHQAMRRLDIELETLALDHRFERVYGNATDSAREMPADFSEYILYLKKEFPSHEGAWCTFESDLKLVWNFAKSLKFPLETKKLALALWRASERRRLVKLLLTSAFRYFSDELALSKEALSFCMLHHVLIGSHPRQLSCLMYLLIHRYYFESPCFVSGGGEAIIKALTAFKMPLDQGKKYHKAELRTRFPISRIERNETSGESGFKLLSDCEAGQMIVARSVIWTPDPRVLIQKANFELPLLMKARLSRAQNPHALCVGYFGTRSSLDELGFSNSNYWLNGELSVTEAYECADLEILVKEAPLYISMGSLRDPFALKGTPHISRGVFQAMFLVPPRSDLWGGANCDLYRASEAAGGYRRQYLSLKNKVLCELVERIEKRFPQLQGQWTWKELGSPLTHHRFLHSESLGGYGFASTIEDLLWSRPSYRTGEKGLYLAGAHTKPAHGIVTSLLSGVGVADKVAEYLDLDCGVKTR